MSEKEKKQRTVRLPNVFEALLPIVVMLGLMLYHFMPAPVTEMRICRCLSPLL